MKNLPLVSVIIAVKDETDLLRLCLNDLLEQTYDNLEIIVVDDGSKQETKDVLDAFTDERIVQITLDENLGQAEARNIGFKEAKGVFIAIADSDDRYDRNRIELQADYLEIHPHIDIVGSQFVVNEGKKQWEIYNDHFLIYHQFLLNNPIIHSSVFFRSELLENGYSYDTDTLPEDYELFAKHRNQWIFHNLKEPLTRYTIKERKKEDVLCLKLNARTIRKKVLLEYLKNSTENEIELHHNFSELNPGINYKVLQIWIDKLLFTQPKYSSNYRDLKHILYRHFWLYLRKCNLNCYKFQKLKVLYKSQHNPVYFVKNAVKIIIGKSL